MTPIKVLIQDPCLLVYERYRQCSHGNPWPTPLACRLNEEDVDLAGLSEVEHEALHVGALLFGKPFARPCHGRRSATLGNSTIGP